MDVSVIICTHNPREDFLRRTLEALKAQTLTTSRWEIILIDNDSKELIAEKWDLSWHPAAKHVREKEIGLTAARLRGIGESNGELIVFVDDDNILDNTYLQNALEISKKWGVLGVWGGCIDPEFEVNPPEWSQQYWYLLAIRDVKKEVWGNENMTNALPCGAGMCVRRSVAQAFHESVRTATWKKSLGRKGGSFGACEDTDLALTACDLGMGYGLFPSLHLVHIIPAKRISEDYLLNLYEGIERSGKLMLESRGIAPQTPTPTLMKRVLDFLRYLRLSPRDRRFWKVRQRAQMKAKLLS